MSETARLADQIRRAFDGDAWHGDPVLELLADVNAKTAAAHPIKNAHSIWELVLHIAAWDGAVLRRTAGTAVELKDKQNFPPVSETGEAAWREAVGHAKNTHNELVQAVPPSPIHASRNKSRARPRAITVSFICSAELSSMSSITPARLLC